MSSPSQVLIYAIDPEYCWTATVDGVPQEPTLIAPPPLQSKNHRFIMFYYYDVRPHFPFRRVIIHLAYH